MNAFKAQVERSAEIWKILAICDESQQEVFKVADQLARKSGYSFHEACRKIYQHLAKGGKLMEVEG